MENKEGFLQRGTIKNRLNFPKLSVTLLLFF